MQAKQVFRWAAVFICTLTPVLSPGESAPASAGFVKQLDLIHFSHTDYGFTDHPAVCRDLQRRYLDLAESLHPGASEPRVFARWLADTPLPPARLLPMVQSQLNDAA